MSDMLLQMKGITKYIFDSYGIALRHTTVKILDKVDFDLKKGEVHILVGENGAGADERQDHHPHRGHGAEAGGTVN